MNYNTFTERNSGIITSITQKKLKEIKILLCGCGIGSYLAEALLRMGCINLTLVDMDTLNLNNLNRQNYTYNNIGQLKVEALKERLIQIYPEANIQSVPQFLNTDNVSYLVGEADIIIDTIDYVDLKAVFLLHKIAHELAKPLISAMNIGFGAGLLYFPPHHKFSLEHLIQSKLNTSHEIHNYQEAFVIILDMLLPYFEEDMRNILLDVAQKLKEGMPCPAPQISAGTMCCASLVATCVDHIISGREIVPFPKFHYLNLHQIFHNQAYPILK